MNSNPIVRRAAAVIACFSVAALAASCGLADEDVLTGDEIAPAEPVASESSALQGWCPQGWVDPDFVQIDCISGYEIRARVFNGNVCVRCARGRDDDPDRCNYPWVRDTENLDCARGDRIIYRGDCKRCVGDDDSQPFCNYPWVRGTQYLECDYGERLIFQGGCKRCVRDPGGGYRECATNDDCMKTGCSGEVCSDEEEITTCEWRDEYQCYSRPFARCVCERGECGWAKTAGLRECLEGARR